MRTPPLSILALLVLAAPAILVAGPITIDFEGLPDGTVLTNQYPGVTFTNAVILTAGISLNEFEFPPSSGLSVASDDGGAMSIAFGSPTTSFSGLFTHTVPLTLRAFDAANIQIASATSLFSDNLALSGDPGGHPNELIQLALPGGFSRVTITGDLVGGSFALDDAAFETPVPEPGTVSMVFLAVLAVFATRKRAFPTVGRSWFLAFGLLAGCGAVALRAAPSLGVVQATPTIVARNTQTMVTVTASITDPSLIPGSVNLLRLDASGSAVATLGTLRDDGTSGDLIAGDKIYTGQAILNEATSGQIRLQISAAFRGMLARVKSSPVPITVQANPVSLFTLFVNGNDALLLEGKAPTGEVVQYLGTKGPTGLATAVTGFTVRDATNNLTRYTLDNSGRPTQILASNNVIFKLVWNSDSTVSITAIAPDGSSQATVRIPVSHPASVSRSSQQFTHTAGRRVQQPNAQSVPTSYLEVDVSKCGLGVSGASVWITVAHPLTGAFDDLIRGIDVGGGTYGVPMPTPDPHAGEDAAEKCSTAVGAIGNACDALQANPLLPVAVCGGLAASGLPISPAVLTVCGVAFAGLTLYCDTLGTGPSEALDQFICPRIGTLVDEYVNRPVDLSLTVNGQPISTRFGVSLSGRFAPFTVPLSCTPVRLNVSKAGAGSGIVTGSPSVINCGGICSDSFLPPSVVQLSATPDTSSTFSGWAGECGGTSNSVPVPIAVDTAASISCLATFDLAAQQPITITKLGSGQGAVTSVPGGINCGPTCSASFATRSQISLTAGPLTGSIFTGWGGDCAGTSATITVTVNTAMTCTATFGQQRPSVRANPFGTHNLSDGPFQVQVVTVTGSQVTPVPAPADITVTLRRDVISQCSGLLFSSNRSATISQGQTSGGSLDAAGRDPACNTLPITTEWTVLQAVQSPNVSLDLSVIPPGQLSVAIVR
jgi:hypothetical protein